MLNEQVKNTYIKFLTKLNRATNNGVKAPHKPILMLSILQLIKKGEYFKVYILKQTAVNWFRFCEIDWMIRQLGLLGSKNQI